MGTQPNNTHGDISPNSRTTHSWFRIFDVIMKLLLLALFVGAALAGDCDEPRPEYCEKNAHLCKVPGFIDFMKKFCPRHCGYCNQNDEVLKECIEPNPAYCAMNAYHCHHVGWVEKMKKNVSPHLWLLLL